MKSSAQRKPLHSEHPAPKAAVTEPVRPATQADAPAPHIEAGPYGTFVNGEPVPEAQAQAMAELAALDAADRQAEQADQAAEAKAVAEASRAEREAEQAAADAEKAAEHAKQTAEAAKVAKVAADKAKADAGKRADERAKARAKLAKEKPRAVAA
jgi:hypothetical protein